MALRALVLGLVAPNGFLEAYVDDVRAYRKEGQV